jgi:hypothetical protein
VLGNLGIGAEESDNASVMLAQSFIGKDCAPAHLMCGADQSAERCPALCTAGEKYYARTALINESPATSRSTPTSGDYGCRMSRLNGQIDSEDRCDTCTLTGQCPAHSAVDAIAISERSEWLAVLGRPLD